MDNKNNEGFSYTYSAREQAEIKKIREKYSNKEEDKMERLRRLDAAVTQKANASALIVGVIGALILGFGMSLAMTDLGSALGMGADMSMALGIVIGLAGLVPVCFAYPMYNFIIKRERKKIAPEIIRLTDELMK